MILFDIIIIIVSIRISTCMTIASYPFILFIPVPLLLRIRQKFPPCEYDHSHCFLCCIAFTSRYIDIVENLCRYSRPFNKVRRFYGLKNDLSLSVSMCKPWTSGHPRNYWPSAKLFNLGDRLEPFTYHTPNAFGFLFYYFYSFYS